jgi:hypothetical protein
MKAIITLQYVYLNQIKSNFTVDQDEFFLTKRILQHPQNGRVKKDDKIEVTHYGISKAYYNYMSVSKYRRK